MVAGKAHCPQGEWQFRWQALACDESPKVSAWLRAAAASDGEQAPPKPLGFIEPNLVFRVCSADENAVTVRVDFDLEFPPSWHRRRGTGDPYSLTVTTTRDALLHGRLLQNHTGVTIKKLVQTLRVARSATIDINGQRLTLNPELSPPAREIIDRLPGGH